MTSAGTKDKIRDEVLKELTAVCRELHGWLKEVSDRLRALEKRHDLHVERFNRYYPDYRTCTKCARRIAANVETCKFCGTLNPKDAA